MFRAVPALSFVALLLVACGSKPQARQPLAVQTETIGEASFSPSIQVISQLSSTTDVACMDVINVWMIVVAMNIPSTMPGRLPISGQRESWGVVG
ncbi:hypothetical protein KBZ15_01255 [Cyanobium sp. BA20m-p-22]|uniref:hypothetical protein n=1 Tax=Cyanobium sp. BA20m-p-22 TaxID=2823704 RepID=UPI0020CCC9FF|nr:hypothetical protein [Cyanobium sp. BA20m-p-22]MCP9908545.1 hypothetical protein [Cyanobium sp. BA20m-p-22]